MVTRVQLDASHVSRCVIVRREKAHRYIRDPNELLRDTHVFEYFFYACENLSTLRENIARFLKFLVFSYYFGGSVADLGVGARSAAATPFCLLQVLEGNQGEGRELERCKVDPDLTRQGSCVLVNRQDHIPNTSLTS